MVLLSLVILLPYRLDAQTRKRQMPEKTRILFVLDASGSMRAEWDGGTRMAAAQEVLTNLINQYQYHSKLEMGLRVYGHQYNRRFKNCEDTRLEVPFAADNHGRLKSKLTQITPQGYTPIALSLEKAAEDFPETKNIRNVIILITDGIESCDRDPCAVSLALQKKHIFLRPFVVGLGIDLSYLDAFKCMGQFYNAKDKVDFRAILDDIMLQTLSRTTVTVELLDEKGKPVEKDVNMTFVNNITQESEYEYVHYRDAAGLTDTLEIDAILTYDLVVNTVPATIKRNLAIKGGRHNVIKVPVAQGTLAFEQSGYRAYEGGVTALIRSRKTRETLTTQQVGERARYLAGGYDVEILTLPRIVKQNVTIRPDQTTTIDIPTPGILNISNVFEGFGSIYEHLPDGGQRWIYNFSQTRMNLPLQPGKYRLVFRSDRAKGSEYTVVKDFDMKPGGSVRLDLSNW